MFKKQDIKKIYLKIHVKRLCFRDCCVIMLVSVF